MRGRDINKTMFNKFSLALTLCLLLSACSHLPLVSPDRFTEPREEPHVKYRKGVSRDFTYLSFTKDARPFKVQSIVGGEHINAYIIYGLQHEEYEVKLLSTTGQVYSSIDSEACETLPDTSNTARHTEKLKRWGFRVQGEEALIRIEVSAHPYAEYELVIQRLD